MNSSISQIVHLILYHILIQEISIHYLFMLMHDFKRQRENEARDKWQ